MHGALNKTSINWILLQRRSHQELLAAVLLRNDEVRSYT